MRMVDGLYCLNWWVGERWNRMISPDSMAMVELCIYFVLVFVVALSPVWQEIAARSTSIFAQNSIIECAGEEAVICDVLVPMHDIVK